MSDSKQVGSGPQPIKDGKRRALFVLLVFILGIVGLYIAYIATFLTLINQILLAMIFIVLTGNLMRFFGGFQGWNFMFLLSTEHGINTIDKISKRYHTFWESLSLWGLVMGLGLLSYPFLKGRISKKLFVFSIISLYFMMVLVLPFTIYGVKLISVSQIQSLLQNVAPSIVLIPQTTFGVILYAIAIVSGFSGYVVVALLDNAVNVLIGVAQFLMTVAVGHPQTSTLTNQLPGVVPIIPGITIPLVAGIISLVILLVVHEGSHGVLSRIAKVKLNSVGLLMVGMIPIGAFVEPDEKQVSKIDSMKQTRIFAAGSSMNFLFALIFFVLMFLFITYITPTLYQNVVLIQSTVPNSPAASVLQPGMQILQWNGYKIENISSFTVADANVTPGSIVTVVTNTGTYSIKAVSIDNSTRGEIGIEVYQPAQTGWLASAEFFIYPILALSLALNFFVALFNLLPIPVFDGWRIYKSNIKNEKIVRFFAYFLVALILINVVSTVLVLLL